MSETPVEIGARIDALPGSRRLWTWVAIIAIGGFFEIYDLALTAPLSSGLAAAGIFRAGHAGIFGLADQATFISATFLGLYLGVVGFAAVGDRWGRRSVFTYSLVIYALATLAIGLQNDVWSICFWRLVAGIGVGAEAVAIDCFVVEIVPARLRGRAFSASMALQYCAIPVCAILAAVLIPHAPLGVTGWRWLTFVPVLGATGIWLARRRIPDSPRWLAARGRTSEASAILDRLDGGAVRASTPLASAPLPPVGSESRSYFLRVTIMLIVYFTLQTIAFYGFANWTPTLLESEGVPLKHSLFYNAGIALAFPLAPIALSLISDRFERKHLIIATGAASVAFGLLFAGAKVPAAWLTFGIGLAFANSANAVASHNYLSEVYPTLVRARLAGFVYSFTRLAAAGGGYLIAFILASGGPSKVFVAISAFMLVALLAMLVAGPKTRNLSSG